MKKYSEDSALNKNFLWGTATAATQIEGAYNEDGKGLTIWDGLTEGHIRYNENCRVSCDHYHRYKEDVALMKEIGVNSYRFSVSWARIYPSGMDKINERGLKFYIDLVDELVKNGIEPLVTLYHWDMPIWLYDIGGFLNSKFPEYFEAYTKTLINALSDKVRYWITFNEPQCFVSGGYETGWLAPFHKESKCVIERITRNVMLAHGRAVDCIRKYAKTSTRIGFAPTASLIMPKNNSEKEIKNAYDRTFDPSLGVGMGAWWSEPIVAGRIPENMKFLSEEDIKAICRPLDFYAFNIYRPENAHDFYYPGMTRSALGWEVLPECVYWASRFYHERYNLPILVSENGFADNDVVSSDGKVHDTHRSYYIEKHIEQVKMAISEGIPVIGYQYWSLIDNFEWAIGYDARFGLIYVDYRTQKRTLKDSAYLYKRMIDRI